MNKLNAIFILGMASLCCAQVNTGDGGGSSPGSNCGDTSHALGWNGAYTCQAITGAAAAGGSTTQLQYNNATALGGIAQFTTNGTTTITGSATSVFDLHAAGTGGLLLPGALSTGIVKVTTSTGAISILTAPAGTIVGTSDAQALTNKDLTGAGNTFPTFNQNTTGTSSSATNFSGSLAGDVTGTQGVTVVAKINGNSVTSGATNNQALICTSANTCVWKTLPDCVGSSNALNFTAATNVFSCLSITTLSNPMTTLGDIIYGGAAGAVTRLAGPTGTNSVPQFLQTTPSGGAAVAPVWSPAGVPTNAQTGTTYTVAATDRASYVTFSNAGAIAVTLPQAGTTGFASNFVTLGCDIGAGTATITPTTSTISYTTGTAYTSAASTMTLATGECAWIYSDNTNYFAVKRAGGGGSGTVTSVATTSPIAGGTITGTGTITCATCVTSAAALTSNAVVIGGGLQASSAISADTTTTHALMATAGAPAFRALVAGDIPTAIPIANVGSAGLSATSPVTIASTGVIACATCNTTAAVATPPLDKSGTGLSNPTADATFTYPIGSTTGFTFAGTAPASVSTATGTNATSLFNVNGVTGGADSNATGTAGIGSSPTLASGAGGSGAGANTVGGAGGNISLTAGAGGASTGTAVNSNGGNIVATPGAAGSGGSGTAGKAGVFQVAGPNAGFFGFQQGTANTTANTQIPANTIIDQAPTAVTAYTTTRPGAAASGINMGANASGIIQQSNSGDAAHAVSAATQTASISTATVCAATAGTACGQAGQYRVSFDVWGSGTACSSVTAGKVVFTLTWTDAGGSTHTAVPWPLYDFKTAAQNVTGTFSFNTALTTEGANGSMIISTNGTIIQYASTYTACTTGTGTYNVHITTEQLQ